MANVIYTESEIVFQPKGTSRRFDDLEGKCFGRLTVLGYAGSENKKTKWWCECECGNFSKVQSANLKNGHTSSCGCFQQEVVLDAKVEHGMSHTPEYGAYCKAKERCENANIKNFDRYGGRGIKFLFCCFEEFLEELGPRPSPDHSVDRKNNNSHYMKGNVKWSTKQEQARNRHTNRAVNQLTMSGEFIRRFDVIADASIALNVSGSHISAACGGKLPHAYGYKWEYADLHQS